MRYLLVIPTIALAGQGIAVAQTPTYSFSIDWRGPTISVPDSGTATPITEGDILNPAPGVPALGPLPPPVIGLPHGAGGLGLAPGCIGHPGGTLCHVEVDALAFGIDPLLTPNGLMPGQLWWSVDSFALSLPAPAPPNVLTEAPVGDSSADAFVNLMPMPGGPLPPFVTMGHVGTVDGDGAASLSGFAYPGVGIVEPNPPAAMPVALGDNLDALDVNEFGGYGPLPLYSVDAPFPDPMTGIPGSPSSLLHGVSGADILTPPVAGVGPIVWAPAIALGLDFFGHNTDDIDALLVWENGSGAFEPSVIPYDWLGFTTDEVLFSVRRGSAVIGMPDSIFGLPIAAGDILTTPLPTFAGGLSPFPGIFIAAENLDLGTLRTGSAGGPFDDDLNSLDAVIRPVFDCNGNGVEDSVDIAMGVSVDANMNGIPDSCEPGGSVGTAFCYCSAAIAPCGNAFPAGGCLNVSGSGAILSGSGSTSVLADDLVLTTTGMNAGTFALTIMGTTPVAPAPINNGNLCVFGTIYRLPPYATGAGTASIGPGLAALTMSINPPAGWIVPLSTWHFQTWYRDVGGPCGSASNLSNALTVTFTP